MADELLSQADRDFIRGYIEGATEAYNAKMKALHDNHEAGSVPLRSYELRELSQFAQRAFAAQNLEYYLSSETTKVQLIKGLTLKAEGASYAGDTFEAAVYSNIVSSLL